MHRAEAAGTCDRNLAEIAPETLRFQNSQSMLDAFRERINFDIKKAMLAEPSRWLDAFTF